jgi:GNAT superfamily N-acetyltransferase
VSQPPHREWPADMPDGYVDLPPGKIASVVTYLEMRRPPSVSARAEALGNIDIRHVKHVSVPRYRALFRAVGADWLWFSRLEMDDDALARVLQDPAVDVLVVTAHGRDAGFAEVDARGAPDVEISFFGVTPDQIGRGVGRTLMDRALARAWQRGASRVWLHTCTLDHPRALSFYERAGFVPFKRAIEVADDPRLRGVLPDSCAPQVPLLRPR